MTNQKSCESVDVLPRVIPEGRVPLIAVEGTAYECGREYAEIVMREYPLFREYLNSVHRWKTLPDEVERLFKNRAPYILELYQGIIETVESSQGTQEEPKPEKVECTSFGVSGSVTLDGQPISGQSKDTSYNRGYLYIVLRMRMKGAPTILTLAYPGEVLGYGMWSTGMSIFRNSLYSQKGAERELSMEQWGLLTLAGQSVHEGVELAKKYGISSAGCCLINDVHGESLSVEFNVGGVGIVPAKDGIATHANHPEGKETAPYEDYPDEIEKENSKYRMHGLWNLLNGERGRLTPQKILMLLAEHTHYPQGICRHIVGNDRHTGTSGVVIVEPTRGKLHVVRGNPCCNWPVTYTI